MAKKNKKSKTKQQKKTDIRRQEKVEDSDDDLRVVDTSTNDKVEEDEEEEMDVGDDDYGEEEGDDNDDNNEEEGENGNNDDEEEDDEEEETEKSTTTKTMMISDGKYRNKQRCLILCSRGVTARYRHLLEDVRCLVPHHKKESKLDPGNDGMARAVNDICEIRGCNTYLFLECRKRQDCYMWMGKPTGPSVKFHVTNVHTMDELRLTGNCMKGSRPIVTFDESFTRVPSMKVLKPLLIDIFGTPRGHPKSKPFIDRVITFFYADNKIWVRNYQILEEQPENALQQKQHMSKRQIANEKATSLVEIGPRFVLNPIRIFRGSFGGQSLFQNPEFISPNEIRAMEYKRKGMSYVDRKEAEKKRKIKEAGLVLPEDPLDSVFK